MLSILTALLGVVIGILSLLLSRKLIINRVGCDFKSLLITSKYAFLIWSTVYCVAFILIRLHFKQDIFLSIEVMLIFSTLASISAVDLLIRKIPNSMLLALIVLQSSFMIYDGNWSVFIASLSALAIGFIAFLVPSIFGLSIGGGDIKLAAVIAYCVGIQGFIIALICMVITLLVYISYLYATKQGNLNTMSALGPFLALGCLIAYIYSPAITF
ncbi:MAG: hypothetical protein K0R18_876 [Bacillales bacterium]|jgi:prepilin signal peptidase PulO-like enzyme (type II secretory pathway)|nr:hypothetical protein [Bacillales bacterium]